FRLALSQVPRAGMMLDLKPGSPTLVVAFAGLKGFLGGYPAFEFRKTLSSVDVKSAFLRDHYSAWYHRGMVDVGPDIDAVAERLRALGREADRLVMIGYSDGGYAAPRVGEPIRVEDVGYLP